MIVIILHETGCAEIQKLCRDTSAIYRRTNSEERRCVGVVLHIKHKQVAGKSPEPIRLNAANILACKLCDRGIKVKMYDTSVTPASYILSDSFKYSHLVFASTTYNNGIFVNMEDLLHDIVNHNLQNRKVAIIENGSWAPASGKLMREEISKMKNMEIIGDGIKLLSALKEDQLSQIDALADAIAESIRG